MAEIKSTMELVMERMAKMTANAQPVESDEEIVKEGMRIGAAFLNDQDGDLVETVNQNPPENHKPLYKGVMGTLLRNVLLPRDEIIQERSELALKGVMDIAGHFGVPAISQICSELTQILQQYNQHKEQVTQQLEDALKSQLAQQYGGEGVDTGSLRASMHPKYHEEMSRMEQDLNGQYNQALEQRKESILIQLGLQ